MHLNNFIIPLLALTLLGCESEVDTHTVERETIALSFTSVGELESKQRARIAPPSIRRMWQYQIKTMVPENTFVKKGQILISFDDKSVRDNLRDELAVLNQAKKELENIEAREEVNSEELKLALAAAETNYAKAKKNASIKDESRSANDIKKAEIDYTIAKNDLTLAQQKLKFQAENRKVNIEIAQAEVQRFTSRVNKFKRDIESLNVKAPMDGIVIYSTNYDGEKSSIGDSVQFGQPVMELSVLEQLEVKAEVNERDFGKIALGQTAQVTFDSADGLVVSGTLTRIGQVFREKSRQDKSKIVDVTIKLDELKLDVMRPGQTARVQIFTETLNDVLTVPKSALRTHKGGTFVETSSGRLQPIKVAHTTSNKLVVASGIEAGSEVVL